MSNTTTFVMMDTMVYLHYLSAEQLCLPELLGADEVTVLVPRITIQELDLHKNTHQNTKTRERARKRLAAIQKWIEAGEIASGLSMTFDAIRPNIDFIAYGLNSQWNDDQLLAAAIGFRDQHPGVRLVILTQDTGMLLTAKHIGIEASMVPDDKKLPDQEDPIAKENKELRNELLRLKAARPELVLSAEGTSDDSAHVEFEIKTPIASPSVDKEEFLKKIRKALPEIHPPQRPPKDSIAHTIDISGALGEKIPESEYRRYNREREEYYKQALDYIDRLEAYHTQPSRTLLLKLKIRNIGMVPAEDVDLFAHFPDGFELYPEHDLPEEPQEPKIPKKPISDIQKMMAGITSGLDHMHYHIPSYSSTGLPDSFGIRKTNSYEVTDHVPRLKHGSSFKIRKLYVVFPSFETATSFSFDYRISAANLPEPATGTIHVVIRKPS